MGSVPSNSSLQSRQFFIGVENCTMRTPWSESSNHEEIRNLPCAHDTTRPLTSTGAGGTEIDRPGVSVNRLALLAAFLCAAPALAAPPKFEHVPPGEVSVGQDLTIKAVIKAGGGGV